MSRIVVIGASAGGVPALMHLTTQLPRDFPSPILVVLHIGAHNSILPSLLAQNCALEVAHARHGETLRAGCIRVAPPDHHMLVTENRIELTRGAKENHSRPAIDPLFFTAASTHGPGAIGVALTGQLDDGTAGLQAIKRRCGISVVQDPADAAEPSMPASALRHVDVDHCLPLALIPMLLQSLASQPLESPMPASDPTLQHEEALLRGDGNPMAHLQAIGRPSPYACQACHGGLWHLLDSRPTRFRCHTGHAYTARSLQTALADTSDDAIWNGMRALEERQLLLGQMAQLRQSEGDEDESGRLLQAAGELSRQVGLLRELTENAPKPPH
ncbi:MAG: chemotaxis protein CheB [Rubrivivax sp.]